MRVLPYSLSLPVRAGMSGQMEEKRQNKIATNCSWDSAMFSHRREKSAYVLFGASKQIIYVLEITE